MQSAATLQLAQLAQRISVGGFFDIGTLAMTSAAQRRLDLADQVGFAHRLGQIILAPWRIAQTRSVSWSWW